ncbi:MAG: FAD-dependent oxidoreductase [Pseudomonadota bacterium]
MGQRAVIVGGGINGLATAWALVRQGWEVELLEQGPLPNPEAASWDAHRLIRPHYADQPGYAARIGAAFAAWEEMWRDLGRAHYAGRGMLALSRAAGDWTERAEAGLTAAGIAHDRLGGNEVARRFPMIVADGVRFALWTEIGGALLADRILADLIRWLIERGVVLRPETAVSRIDAERATVETAEGPVSGDVVVIAAGIGLRSLLPEMAGEWRPHRSTVLYVAPPPQWLEAWAKGPCWVDLGGGDDHWGMPPVDAIPMKLGLGRHTRPGDPLEERVTTEDDVRDIMGAYHGRFADWDQARPIRAVANFYLMAPDSLFHLKRVGRSVVISADSGHGFKFGALTGLDVAEAIETERWNAVATRVAGAA